LFHNRRRRRRRRSRLTLALRVVRILMLSLGCDGVTGTYMYTSRHLGAVDVVAVTVVDGVLSAFPLLPIRLRSTSLPSLHIPMAVI